MKGYITADQIIRIYFGFLVVSTNSLLPTVIKYAVEPE